MISKKHSFLQFGNILDFLRDWMSLGPKFRGSLEDECIKIKDPVYVPFVTFVHVKAKNEIRATASMVFKNSRT